MHMALTILIFCQLMYRICGGLYIRSLQRMFCCISSYDREHEGGKGGLTFYSPLIEKSSCWYSEWAEDGRTHGKSDSTIMLNPLFRATWWTSKIKLSYYITTCVYCPHEPADNWLTATQTVGSSQPQKQCNRTQVKKDQGRSFPLRSRPSQSVVPPCS